MASLTLLLLRLLLVVPAASAWYRHYYRYYGGSVTFTPKGQNSDGTYNVELRGKQTTHYCNLNYYSCTSGNCGTQTKTTNTIVARNSYGFNWCQYDVVKTVKLHSNLPFEIRYPTSFNSYYGSGYWISNIRSSQRVWRMMAHVDLGTRSDTGESNRSPIAAVLPLLRVNRNCPRSFNLTVFDPDGDHVRCRIPTHSSTNECGLCGLPTGFSFDQSSCSIQYTYSTRHGYHPIELMLEDFPNKPITVSYSDGSYTEKNPLSVVRRKRSIQSTTTTPTTAATTTAFPTTAAPTTAFPTTAAPTTAFPTTAAPTTAAPTTAAPITLAPTTAFPTTAAPTTVASTTAFPTTTAPTTLAPTTVAPTTAFPTTTAPTTAFPTTTAPTTAAPTTAAPTTAAPITLAPTTAFPTTAAPTTVAPTTAAPTTVAPTTAAPTTAFPTTTAPTTAAPTTVAPTTAFPTTTAPTTAAPTTAAPTTLAPTTAFPTTTAPTTAAPTTAAPTTLAPTTAFPTTAAPTTVAPTTAAPTTAFPTTAAPTTVAPTTAAPTTLAPTTAFPTTAAPTTAAPTTLAPTTVAPTTVAPTTRLYRTPIAPLSKLPLQFTVHVDSYNAPSCLYGDYFPIFLSPTPRNGVNLPAFVNHTLEIRVRSTAQYTTIYDLIVSGPKGISKQKVSTEEYIIKWTPTENEVNDHFPICFVSEAKDRYNRIFQSELRCVIADVGRHETTVTCNETTITVEVEKSYLIRRNEDNLHLNEFRDASCNLTTRSNTTHLVAVMSLNECGTSVDEDADNIIFKNEITSADPDKIISRQHDVEIAFSCVYPKRTNLTLGFKHKNPYAFTEKGFGAFTFQFEFFESQRFRKQTDASTYPVEVYLKQMIFMQIEATSSIPNTELFVETCRATPYDNPNSRISYTIIKHGCVEDSTVQIYPSPKSQFRFGIEAFEFIGAHEKVYITCTVMLCETGIPGTRCSQGCVTSNSGSHRRKREAVAQSSSHSISQGPLHLVKTSDSQASGPSLNLGLNIVFIAGCLVAVGVVIHRSRRSRAKYQRLPTSDS